MLIWACFSMRSKIRISFITFFNHETHQAFPSILLCALSWICRLGFIDHHFHGCQFNFYFICMYDDGAQHNPIIILVLLLLLLFLFSSCDVVHSSRLLNDDVERESDRDGVRESMWCSQGTEMTRLYINWAYNKNRYPTPDGVYLVSMLALKLRSLIELSSWLLLICLEDIIALLRPFDLLHLQHYSQLNTQCCEMLSSDCHC